MVGTARSLSNGPGRLAGRRRRAKGGRSAGVPGSKPAESVETATFGVTAGLSQSSGQKRDMGGFSRQFDTRRHQVIKKTPFESRACLMVDGFGMYPLKGSGGAPHTMACRSIADDSLLCDVGGVKTCLMRVMQCILERHVIHSRQAPTAPFTGYIFRSWRCRVPKVDFSRAPSQAQT